jgi:hypothetical protein
MKTTAIVFLVLLMLFGIVACSSGNLDRNPATTEIAPVSTGQESQSPGIRAITTSGLNIDRVPDNITQFGQAMEINLIFTSYDSETRTMSPFPASITIESRVTVKPHDSLLVRSFAAGPGQVQIQPGESAKYLLAWDQRDDQGRQMPYGWYSLRAQVKSWKSTNTSSTQGSGAQAAQVLILPPEGAMEKTLTVNSSQKAGGVEINLEKIELSLTGMRVYTFTTPANYDPRDTRLPNQLMGHTAKYKIDDEDWKPAVTTEFGTFLLEKGVRHIWDLDPAPGNARELFFTISTLGGWEGPWKFDIPLQ